MRRARARNVRVEAEVAAAVVMVVVVAAAVAAAVVHGTNSILATDLSTGILQMQVLLLFILMANQPSNTVIETSKFEGVLAREPFTGLKAILDNLARDRDAQSAAFDTANSYEELL